MLPMPCPALPPELIQLIIDLLRDDKQSLKSTSLLCRKWFSRSRRHLFRAICVKFPRKFGPFLECLVENETREPLCGEPPISQLITSLHLCGPDFPRPKRNQSETTNIRPPIISAIFLRSLLSALPKLKELHLYRVQVHIPRPSTELVLPWYIRSSDENPDQTFSLDALTLGDIWTSSTGCHEVLVVLKLFSSIGTLYLGKSVCPSFLATPDDVLIDGPTPRHGITSSMWYRYRAENQRSLVKFLISHMLGTLCTVNRIYVSHSLSPYDPLVSLTADMNEQNIKHLTLDLTTPGYFVSSAPDPDPHSDPASGLTTIAFRCGLQPGTRWNGNEMQHPFSPHTESLAKGAPRSVQTFVFVFYLQGTCILRDLPHYRRLFREAIGLGRGWLDAVLPTRPDSKIAFVLECPRESADMHEHYSVCEALSEMVKGRFAQLYESGTLSVTIR